MKRAGTRGLFQKRRGNCGNSTTQKNQRKPNKVPLTCEKKFNGKDYVTAKKKKSAAAKKTKGKGWKGAKKVREQGRKTHAAQPWELQLPTKKQSIKKTARGGEKQNSQHRTANEERFGGQSEREKKKPKSLRVGSTGCMNRT